MKIFKVLDAAIENIKDHVLRYIVRSFTKNLLVIAVWVNRKVLDNSVLLRIGMNIVKHILKVVVLVDYLSSEMTITKIANPILMKVKILSVANKQFSELIANSEVIFS